MNFRLLPLLVLLTICIQSAPAQTTATLPLYSCRRTLDPITVDGRLSEKTWLTLKPLRLGLWNVQGQPAKQTLVTLAWDDANLYLVYQVEDDEVINKYSGRDEKIFEQEVVEFFVDPANKRQNYYEFEWNGHGAALDLAVTYPNGKRKGDFAWNAQMRWSIQSGEINIEGRRVKGWTCEIAIPFKDLRPGPAAQPQLSEQWAANIYRIEMVSPDKKEHHAWSPVHGSGVSFHRPQYFGNLVFEK